MVGELSGVTVPIAEANSVLTAVLWICICIGFPATSVRGKTLAQLLHLIEAGLGGFGCAMM